jgi:uncharacterized protein (DUF427 family)
MTDRLRAAASLWRWTGRERPPFADVPGEGQESVWDYPRPPALVDEAREVIVRVGGVEVVRTRRALRMLETASPPTFYLPFADAVGAAFVEAPGASHCEWKGGARYWTIVAGGVRLERAAWSYDTPLAPYAQLRDHVALYATHAECLVDGERARPQDGGFYGGWVTDDVVGPWKGKPGSSGW